MGCSSSKQDAFTQEDSIHHMITSDQKKRAKEGKSTDVQYRPRQEHPMLATESSGHSKKNRDSSGHTATVEADDSIAALKASTDSKKETERLLFHSANHNDSVDPRDKILAHEDNNRVSE
mmetsp:Transcript_12390/g.25694  ORF Transcript_12390/g.25694 Transcript_12390/m.25694 type:complete len:120 (-) Transcript_12390:280-639(-)